MGNITEFFIVLLMQICSCVLNLFVKMYRTLEGVLYEKQHD